MGVYPEISLAEARKRHQSARRLLGDGIDPSADKKNRRSLSREVESNTFEAVAYEWLRIRGPKSDGGDKRLHRLLAKDLFPFIGNRPVARIEHSDTFTSIELTPPHLKSLPLMGRLRHR